MAGYKSYRKSKVKNYQRGGAVSGQTTAAPERMGRRSTDSPYGTSPGGGEHTPDRPMDLWPKGHIINWHGRGRGYAQGYYGSPDMPGIDYTTSTPWNPPDQPRYQKGGKVGAGPGPGEHTPNYPTDLWPKGYVIRWMGMPGGAQGGPQAPNNPGNIDYSSAVPWNPPDEPMYQKGGKVMDQYLKGKKKKNGKKKDKFKAMTETSKRVTKPMQKKKPMKKATKEGGIELIKSMRGMSLRELMDLNKKMVRG